jgi:NADH:ubiquinone oxidoreductase subunit 4 (subunit M)
MVTYSVIISPFIVKFPVFFLHIWLPKAHVEAPSIGSIQLAGVLLKLGSYGFVRLNSLFKIQYRLIIIILFCLICCIRISCGAIQNDSKIVVAYNSIGHINLIFIFTLICFQSSKDASALLSITHGISSSILFFIVGDFYQSIKTRSIFYFRSILRINFINNIIILIFLISNLGIPPFFSSFIEITIIGL